jgi:glucosyl-3-phosphoglycerate synthase
VRFTDDVVIGLDQTDKEQFAYARNYFSRLKQRHEILWNDGPGLRSIDDTLARSNLSPSKPGKRRNVWYCIGYTLACQNSDVVALHDCDILTYSRDMLARLVLPIANPASPYLFCKGYYLRITDGKNNDILAALLHRHSLFMHAPGITGVGVQTPHDIAKMIGVHMPLL